MALLSAQRIEQLFGRQMDISAVSGTVDGSTHTDLMVGETVVLSDVPYPAGNFICREGQRDINGTMRTVQTVGWLTPTGRMINLGSMYKKNHLDARNPASVGLPISTVNRAELLPLLFGGTVTVGAKEEIEVKRFNPKPEETATVKGSWYAFTFVPKA